MDRLKEMKDQDCLAIRSVIFHIRWKWRKKKCRTKDSEEKRFIKQFLDETERLYKIIRKMKRENKRELREILMK